MKGLSEAFSWILKTYTYRICTAVKPHTTLRNMPVRPKDRISDEKKPELVSKIPCKTVNVSMLEKQEGHWEQK